MSAVVARNLTLGLTLFLVLAFIDGSRVLAEDERPSVPSPYVADFTGPALIHCVCIAGTSGCSSDFFWKAAGSPVHDWWQDAHVIKDEEADLVSACYRKRDVEKLGNGLCCAVNEKDGRPDETMLRGFFGVSEVRSNPKH